MLFIIYFCSWVPGCSKTVCWRDCLFTCVAFACSLLCSVGLFICSSAHAPTLLFPVLPPHTLMRTAVTHFVRYPSRLRTLPSLRHSHQAEGAQAPVTWWGPDVPSEAGARREGAYRHLGRKQSQEPDSPAAKAPERSPGGRGVRDTGKMQLGTDVPAKSPP